MPPLAKDLPKKAARTNERLIYLGPGLPPIPERLLLAHARGEVLFICGAGISLSAGLPDFRALALQAYSHLDPVVHAALLAVPDRACNLWDTDCSKLNHPQSAEVKRFVAREYDVVLGMLERRLDDSTRGDSQVRRVVSQFLRTAGTRSAQIHKSLIKLSDRGGTTTIVTTNFDLLLEDAARRLKQSAQTYCLGSIPRPTHRPEFNGVLHIHGGLEKNENRFSELVLTDQDFGEFYLRRRSVPDFIYDAARLFHLVLVGYSASDPPMRYLLNAVAADGVRFDDLKERFAFFGTDGHDPVAIEDWKARGITPIPYLTVGGHTLLQQSLERWANLSPNSASRKAIDAEIVRIVKTPRSGAGDEDKDLFDHIIRRGNLSERLRLSKLTSDSGADFDWLNAIVDVGLEREKGLTP